MKLSLPISVPSAASVMNFIPDSSPSAVYDTVPPTEDIPAAEMSEPVAHAADTAIAEGGQDIPQSLAERQSGAISPEDMIYRLYYTVFGALAAAVLLAYIICAVRFSRLDRSPLSEEYPGLRLCRCELCTPAVFGIFRPVILIPKSVEEKDRTEIYHIILHERAHIRHHDQLFNLLTLLICCANWYNPLAWVCRSLYLKDAERWCDEAVLGRIGEDGRRAYARTLLSCAEVKGRPLLLLSGFGESGIKSRVRAIVENKKLRRGGFAAALILIAVIAVVFGTGRALRAEMTLQSFVPTIDGRGYVQKFIVSGGETATVTLKLDKGYSGDFSPDNYYRFTIGIDNDAYTIQDAYAEITMINAESFRILPDGERITGSELVYGGELGEDGIELTADFIGGEKPIMLASVSYTLKKGPFTVGSYIMETELDLSNFRSYMSQLEAINDTLGKTGFVAAVTETGYEAYSSDGSTPLRVVFDDFTEGAVVRDGNGNELPISGFNPNYIALHSADVTGDGVNELIILKHITGTGILQNSWHIIDGANLREIAVDTDSVSDSIEYFINSSRFADFAAGIIPAIGLDEISEEVGAEESCRDIFTEKRLQAWGDLFSDGGELTDNISVYAGLYIGVDDGGIIGRAPFGLIRSGEQGEEFSPIYETEITFIYDGEALTAYEVRFVNE